MNLNIKTSVVILLMTMASSIAYAQVPESKKESYKSYKSRSSVSEINRILLEAEQVKSTSPKQALEKVKEALAMSISQSNVMAEAKCYVLLGEINMEIEEWKLALENFRSAQEKLASQKVNDSETFRKSVHGLGKASLMLKDYTNALQYLNQATKIPGTAEQMKEVELDLSEVHYQMGNYTESLMILEKSQVPTTRINSVILAKIENQKAKIYARLNQVEKANNSIQSSQNFLRSSPSRAAKEEEAIVQSGKEALSDVYYEQKKYDEEIVLRNQSIDYNLENNNASEVSKDKVELSKALIAKGDDDSAIRELKEAAFIADTIGDPKKQAVAYLSLAELYARRGDDKASVSTYKKYSEAVLSQENLGEKKLLEKSELIKTQRDIEELTKYVQAGQQEETLAQVMLFRQRLIIYGLILIILIIAVTSWFIYKNAMASKVANQLLALKSLRSQMNPHFIFNALNSVNQFISMNDERTANRYLSEFSRLMRLVLENSQEDFIPLHKEEEIITLYLKLEHYRFRDKFTYEILFDPAINRESIEIPPMLIQPYIENAVWHGLRYRESTGFLRVELKPDNDNLLVVITDNGIGRKRSGELKTENQKKQQSTGLKNIEERLRIINRVYKRSFEVKVEDLENGQGTVVSLRVPVDTKKEVYA